jgi:putative xylitol transport system permease protein
MVERSQGVRSLFQRYGIAFAFVLLCLFLTFSNKYFLTSGNILNVLRQTSINGILAMGMTLVILTGGIDLSVGSVLGCAGMVTGSLVTGEHPYPAALAISAGLLVGGLLGCVNGLLVAKYKIPPFVATLGMLSSARGLTYMYSNGQPIPSLSDEFLNIGKGVLFGVPIPVFIFLSVFLILYLVLARTVYGRRIYAVGGNEKSARTAGISTKAVIFFAYVICGLLSGLAGLILTARTSSALPQAGIAYELDAIAAVVIGGTSLSGGVGGVVGSLLGALIIGVINNGLDLLGVDSSFQQVIKGAIIVGAVLLDARRHDSN